MIPLILKWNVEGKEGERGGVMGRVKICLGCLSQECFCIFQLAWLTSASGTPSAGVRVCMGAGNLNSDLHAYMASIVWTEPSPKGFCSQGPFDLEPPSPFLPFLCSLSPTLLHLVYLACQHLAYATFSMKVSLISQVWRHPNLHTPPLLTCDVFW